MRVMSRFGSQLAIWTGLLLAIFVVLSASSGDVATVMASLPGWTGRALALGAFPAGLSVSHLVLPDGPARWRHAGPMLVVTAALAILAFAMANWAAPWAQRVVAGGDLPFDPLAAGALTFGQLHEAMRLAVTAARGTPDVHTVAHWLPANALVYQHDMRLFGSVLPLLFAWIGILAGFWTKLTRRADVRQVQHWALGLFLVMSTYLAGENSYELIVLQAAGPSFFAGLFILFIPVMVVCGLGWPALLVLWHRVESGGD